MKQLNLKSNMSTRAPRAGVGLLSAVLFAAVASPLPAQDKAGTVTAPAPKKIEWKTDLNAALAEAKEKNKLVLLRFTADWCAPCRVMDARVWPDTAVQAALIKDYLIVKSDIDVDDNHLVAQKYGVQAVPTLLVLDGNGDEIERGGFMSSQKLVKFLDSAVTATDESQATAGDK